MEDPKVICTFTLRLDSQLKAKIKAIAKMEHRNQQAQIIHFLEAAAKEYFREN
ncbi:hypothetical protein [Chroococcidiopsis sp.]|uniref:hypothetical protein n=1 Tax=Chroococcidiopsis sp. TaxID=3088168 RepID=UPI003F32C359